jgi:RNA recognition motif-containing protein
MPRVLVIGGDISEDAKHARFCLSIREKGVSATKGPLKMSTKLYVGNLSFDTTEETLRSLFEADGRRVDEVAIVMDRETNRPRGFAFVQMATPDDSQKAIQALNGREVEGRTLTVSEARPKAAPRSYGR